ncbi:hypothetical protein Taro_013482 [Colocasia esculenta]|uniref:Uncharacterized protein n=1 Tax=Colocasia esculenta TaxID=4460 RepID=A0A843UM88_COLES|nr:hypothetical protein [Colocasia esculenta]
MGLSGFNRPQIVLLDPLGVQMGGLEPAGLPAAGLTGLFGGWLDPLGSRWGQTGATRPARLIQGPTRPDKGLNSEAKQKRNNRKGKERVRDEKIDTIAQEKDQAENISSERILEELSENPALSVPDNAADASDVSDGVDDVAETLQPDLDERDVSPVSWDADTPESHPATETTICEMQNEQAEKKGSSVMDDSSSTCSTDSIPSVVMNGPYKRNALSSNKASSSPSRGMAIEEVVTLQKKAASKELVEDDSPSKPRVTEQLSPASPIKSPSTLQQPKHTPENVAAAEAVPIKESSSNSENQTEKSVSLLSRSPSSTKQEAKSVVPTKIATAHQVSAMSRPPSAPLIPAPKSTVPFVSSAQTVPLLSRSVSAAGRLGADTSPSTHSNVLQSYRNAIMNKTTSAGTPNFGPRPSSSSTGPTPAYAQSLPAFAPSPSATSLQKPARVDHASVRPGLTFGSVNPESLQTRRQWTDEHLQFESTSTIMQNPNLVCDMQRLDVSGTRPCSFYFDDATSMRQALGVAQDEFPHLDIINDLLDEEQSVTRLGSSEYHHLHHATLNRQYTFPGDISTAADVGTSNGSCYFDRLGQYYDDGIPRLYGSTSGHFDLTSNQLDLSAYVNGQLDGVNRSQWPISSVDHSILGLGSAETNGYPYQLPDSSNMACGLNGYSMYRPASGL